LIKLTERKHLLGVYVSR